MSSSKTEQLWWAQRDTRWDPYPQPQPTELVKLTSEGFFASLPDGRWYKTAASFVCIEKATEVAEGTWQKMEGVNLSHYVRS